MRKCAKSHCFSEASMLEVIFLRENHDGSFLDLRIFPCLTQGAERQKWCLSPFKNEGQKLKKTAARVVCESELTLSCWLSCKKPGRDCDDQIFNKSTFPVFHEKHQQQVDIKQKRTETNNIESWNPKQPFINGCFNWMIPNLYIGNGCFTKHPFFIIFLWLFGVPGLKQHWNLSPTLDLVRPNLLKKKKTLPLPGQLKVGVSNWSNETLPKRHSPWILGLSTPIGKADCIPTIHFQGRTCC